MTRRRQLRPPSFENTDPTARRRQLRPPASRSRRWRWLEEAFSDVVVAAWSSGWQPHELVRHARRCGDPGAASLAKHVIAADHAGRQPRAYHPQWAAQIEQLALPASDGEPGWIDQLLEGAPAPFQRHQAISLLEAWSNLGSLPCLVPPPEGIEATVVIDLRSSADADPMLGKVRALLAKAEATSFPAEAEAFTAKAHALMARHLIDEALLAASDRDPRRSVATPVTIRLPVDPPYVDAKSMLVQVVAEAGGCRSVFHPIASMSSVVGHPSDVSAVELLYTSLLVQAQSALHAESSSGSHRRSRRFRASFLVAYTHRIGERLQRINRDVQADVEASTETDLVPVLAQRSAAVQDYFDALFDQVTTKRSRRTFDQTGVVSGQQAANRARLDTTSVSGSTTPLLGS